MPDPAPDVEQKGRVKVMVELARRENLTIRQLYKRIYGQRGHRVVIGTAAEVADALEQWFRGGAADGFNILPLTFPRGLEDIVNLLIPELQRRGLFRMNTKARPCAKISGCRFRIIAGRSSGSRRVRGVKPYPACGGGLGGACGLKARASVHLPPLASLRSPPPP